LPPGAAPDAALARPVPRVGPGADSPGPLRRALGRARRRINRACADFWMNFLFWHARRQPWFAAWSKPFWMFATWRVSEHFYGGLMTNAARILGPQSTPPQREALARRTMASFYDFVCDVGFALGCSRRQLAQRAESIEGHEHYLAARNAKKGAIIVTAHMGSFEVGVAALLEHETKIHVLFRPDPRNLFEQIRSTLRRRLGVIEVPVDLGWTLWMRLREALRNNQAVLIQGDRVLPGQKGQAVPFFGGHTLLPTGPVKLALASGAPIVPVFSVRTPRGKVRLFVEPAILVGEGALGADEALLRLGSLIEKYVRRFPDQWLANQPAWIEDQGRPMPRPPLVVKVENARRRVSRLFFRNDARGGFADDIPSSNGLRL
jgi:KDO2-lipid IV(A) lauroyltransferase